MHKAFNVSSSSNFTKSIKPSPLPQTFKLSPIPFYDNHSLTLAHYISKVNKSLGFLNNHYNVIPTNYIKSNPLLNKMYSLMPDAVSNSFVSNVRFQIKEVNNQLNSYILTPLDNQN